MIINLMTNFRYFEFSFGAQRTSQRELLYTYTYVRIFYIIIIYIFKHGTKHLSQHVFTERKV